MTLEEIKKWIEDNKDKQEVKDYVAVLNPISVDGVKEFIKTDEGKRWLDSEKDLHSSKNLETWKKNNLEKLVEDRADDIVKKRYPQKDEKETQIEKLQREIDEMKKADKRKELTNKALKLATEKKLPLDIIDNFIAEDEELTVANIEMLEKVLKKQVDEIVQERLKGSYQPPKNDGKPPKVENPWKKETMNLTEQGRILREDPELAKKLMAEAKI